MASCRRWGPRRGAAAPFKVSPLGGHSWTRTPASLPLVPTPTLHARDTVRGGGYGGLFCCHITRGHHPAAQARAHPAPHPPPTPLTPRPQAQTREAISHARAAGCPIVVAITKCDAPHAQPTRVRQQLIAAGLELEEVGGNIQVCAPGFPGVLSRPPGWARALAWQALEALCLLLASTPRDARQCCQSWPVRGATDATTPTAGGPCT